jgi:FMN phosphatase YigB (HAD superfamily)
MSVSTTSQAMTDRRLQAITSAITARAIKVLSVDVFDTLIWRKVPDAHDAFWLLGQWLKDKGLLAAHVSPAQFAELRLAAERKARAIKEKATGTREITLDDIYSILPATVFRADVPTIKIVQTEVDLERSLMLPDREVATAMAEAKAAGIQVILVSDTYYSADELRSFIVAAHGEMPPCDRLVISNEESKPKWRDLFDHLIPQLGVAPVDILHVGDNIDADVMPCRRLGMQSLHYDKWVFSPRVQLHELPKEAPARRALLGLGGDYGLTGLRSRLYHRVPFTVLHQFQPYWRYGATVLGPVLAAFAHWMVHECRQNKFPKVFGLMREGRFLNRLLDRAAEQAGLALETEELWLSRRAVVRAAVYPDDLSHLASFISYCPGLTMDEMLAQAGLTRDDLTGLNADGRPFDLFNGDDLMRLCAFIEQNEQVKAKVCAVSAASRRNLINALSKQIDLNGTTPFVVMDLGYAATIQVILDRILRRENFTVPLVGLYLALNDAAAQNMLAGLGEGVDLRGYLGHEGFNPDAARILTAVPYVLEHATMCREGSLFEFDAAGAPVLLKNARDEQQLVQMEVMQDGIIACVDAIEAQLGADFRTAAASDEALKRQVESIIVTSTLYPAREEVAALGKWRHEAKYDAKDLRRFADLSIDAAELEHKGLAMLSELTGQQSYWPAASLSFISPFLGDFYAAGVRGTYKAPHLETGPLLGTIALCPDHGQGFVDAMQGAIALSVNAFGASEIDATIKPAGGPAYQRLRLRWPQTKAVLKLVSMELTYSGSGFSKKVDMLDPARAGAWQFTGMREIEDGAKLTLPEGPQAIVDLAAVTPPWDHALSLKMRYKYLKLDSLFMNRPAS